MSDTTNIEWCDTTWNPVRGCSKVSPGCTNCYAERTAARFAGPSNAYDGLVRIGDGSPRWTGEVRIVPSKLDEPLRWRKPRRVFVNSMSDLFHEKLTDDDIDRVFVMMQAARQHTFQVLTKRARRMREYFAGGADDRVASLGQVLAASRGWCHANEDEDWPLSNVHVGVSVENQAAADERIPLLLETPAAVRFLSVEPLLGPVDLKLWMRSGHGERRVSWAIVGGESGPGARPCNVAWIRSVVQQCQTAGVPCFVKQLGAVVHDRNDRGFIPDRADTWPEDTDFGDSLEGMQYQGAPVRVHLRDRKGGDPSEWPADLRVRQFPEARHE